MSFYPSTFARRELSLGDAKYAVLGAPYDSSLTYRVGARFAPNAIREASSEIEDYDFEEDYDLLKLKICDLGNVEVSYGNFDESCGRIGDAVRTILENNAIPVCLGGEHTISYCVVKALPKNFFYLVFDAHLDFRNEYIGDRFSHACVTRRVVEEIGAENVLVVGVRSACKEELKDASDMGLKYMSFFEYVRNKDEFLKHVLDEIRKEKLYVSIDMDVLDPSEAGGVCNPEPPGFSYRGLVDLLSVLKEHKLAGMDVVEVTPLYDSYIQVLASKITFKALVMNEKE